MHTAEHYETEYSRQNGPIEYAAAAQPKSSAAEILASASFFSSISQAELAQLLSKSAEETYEGGDEIVIQGEYADSTYVVLSGQVRVVQSLSDTTDVCVAELGPGEVFGELGVLRSRPRNATVLTLKRTRCVRIPAARFLAILDGSTNISMALLRIVAGRV